jgi:hypothetical protein
MTEPTKREIELEMENCQLRNEVFQLSSQLLQYQVQENRQRFDILQKDYIQMKEQNPEDNPEPVSKDKKN